MIEINQFELSRIFSDPSAFYEQMVNRRGYKPKPAVIEFDAEFVATWWTSLGCSLCCVMVHRERKAYLVMLNPEDLGAMRESLTEILTALNTNQLVTAGAAPFPFAASR